MNDEKAAPGDQFDGFDPVVRLELELELGPASSFICRQVSRSRELFIPRVTVSLVHCARIDAEYDDQIDVN